MRRQVYLTEDEWIFLAVVGRPNKTLELGEERRVDDWYLGGKVSFHLFVEPGNFSWKGINVGNPCVKMRTVGKKEFEEFLCDKVLIYIEHVVPVVLI
jgi:hypothetical protein